MPRLARVDIGNHVYHVINRANGRLKIFETKDDYLLFEKLLNDAKQETGMRILAYVLMPNHWHLVLYPHNDGDLGIFMHRLTNAHTRLVHVLTNTIGHGHLYQGRYKSFLVDKDSYLLTLIKYVERNPVRARLIARCEDWRWGSAWHRINGTDAHKKILDTSPTSLPDEYRKWINVADKDDDIATLRTAVNKGIPYGRDTWIESMVSKHNLASTLRSAGRPKKIS
jgi:putative transposase